MHDRRPGPTIQVIKCHNNQANFTISYFQTRAAESRVMWKTTPNFALFDLHVKIRGGVDEICTPIIEALHTTEPPEYS